MDMQDKDLDKLFQSALDDYEMEPSARVWKGITEELDANKSKRLWLPYLSVAAGVILLVTAGLLFIPKEVKHTTTKPDGLVAVKQPMKPSPVAQTQPQIQHATVPNKQAGVAVIAPVNNLASNKIKTHKPTAVQQPNVIAQPVNDVVKQDDQPVIASATPGQQVMKPVVPDAVPIIEKPHIDETPVLADVSPTMPAQAIAAKQPAPAKKHKIRSLGDVFNVMIAAVDKRKDKIIEFSNTDEDDATITGVNLGIIKVKKEK